jgi:hypothetical protein
VPPKRRESDHFDAVLAAELLGGGRGVLVSFKHPAAAIANAAIELLDNDAARKAMRKRAYLYAPHMIWGRVAQSSMGTFMGTFVRAPWPYLARLGFVGFDYGGHRPGNPAFVILDPNAPRTVVPLVPGSKLAAQSDGGPSSGRRFR